MPRRLLPLLLLVTLAVSCSDDPGGSGSGAPSASATSTGTPSTPTSSAPTAVPSSSVPSAVGSTRPTLQGTPKLVQVAALGGLSPMFVTAPPGDERLFIAERAGRIRIVKGGQLVPEPFLDIRDLVSTEGERGLLHFAFAPDYASSGTVYVLYVADRGDVTLARVKRGANPDRLDASSRETVLAIPHPNWNHNGGSIVFDRAGMLLWSIGDGGGSNDPDNNAQDLGALLGKILRLDVGKRENGRPYAIPQDNPFRDVSGAQPEVYAVGLRNPWRFTLDTDGTAYVGDVGQYVIEEISVVPADRLAGANFGWPAFEGRRRTSNRGLPAGVTPIEPTLVYNHDDGGCAVTGGYVYRGRVAALQGKYVFADVCNGEVLAVPPGQRNARPERTGMRTQQLVSFGQDAFGDVYVVSLAGHVYVIGAG